MNEKFHTKIYTPLFEVTKNTWATLTKSKNKLDWFEYFYTSIEAVKWPALIMSNHNYLWILDLKTKHVRATELAP